MAVAKAIAELKRCEFGGCYRAHNDLGKTFFVPDDTLMRDEAVCLDIGGPEDIFGGVVPYPFVKTKAITHGLIDSGAAQPEGWSSGFTEKVRDAVLPGYTVFSVRDARIAAERLLAVGSVRAKPPLATGGRAQRVVTTAAQMDEFLARIEPDPLASYGLVLEPDLAQPKTLSVGHITLDGITITYYGTQRSTTDNEGRTVYGGSDLICVRGGWDALDGMSLRSDVRAGTIQARTYDHAMAEYPGLFASRRNYDIGQGVDATARWRSGVFEASWRIGGASTAEVAAMAEFQADPALQIVGTSTVKAFGSDRHPPKGAVVHFCGDDPEAGPVMRYTLVRRRRRGASLDAVRTGCLDQQRTLAKEGTSIE
jgi:hypothetical protein